MANILETSVDNRIAFVFWGISCISTTFFTLGYYLKFLNGFDDINNRLAGLIILVFPLLFGYYLERYTIRIDNKKIIVYRFFGKKIINITDITRIKEGLWRYKFYIKTKRIFTVNTGCVDMRNFDCSMFIQYIKDRMKK
jgi:hypothetical protein